MTAFIKKYRYWIVGIAIVILLAGATKYFYDKYQNAKVDVKVGEKKTANAITKGQIAAQEAKQAESDADFKADQKNSVESAKSIQKERSTQKQFEYEKPEIIDRDYDYMRSVLDSARAE